MFGKEPGGEIPILQSSGTTNTMLAAALTAMGIPLHTERPFSVATGDGIVGDHRVTFYFEQVSICGQYSTAELLAAWEDREWHDKHPEHPFAYIKCAMQNYGRLLDKLKKEAPIGVIRKHKKLALISLNASQHLQDLILRRL